MTPEEEKVHFDTFGFIIRRGLFGPEEMQKFSHWFDEGCDAQCGPFTGERQMGYPGLSIHEGSAITTLMTPRILDTLENLMGEDFMLVASDAQRHSGNSHWHQDTVIPMEEGKASEYLMLKVIMYLDDHSEGPGCLWVLPGSHRRGYAESIRGLIGMGNPTDVDTLTQPVCHQPLSPAQFPPKPVRGTSFSSIRSWHIHRGVGSRGVDSWDSPSARNRPRIGRSSGSSIMASDGKNV